jgi:4-hydroxy-tetrahydrodipicolinate synthase
MRTSPIDVDTLRGSVIAVPPLARDAAGMPDQAENAKIIAWLASGGVSSFMYGGNANAFHLTLEAYAAMLDQLVALAPADAWMLPAIGADFGKAMAQIPLLRERRFPTASCCRAARRPPRRGWRTASVGSAMRSASRW